MSALAMTKSIHSSPLKSPVMTSRALFGIISVELFPFDGWGGFLVNFYLDNRVLELGLKVQLYNTIQAVLEGELLHSTLREDGRLEG